MIDRAEAVNDALVCMMNAPDTHCSGWGGCGAGVRPVRADRSRFA